MRLYNYETKGEYELFLPNGKYIFECWGASGGGKNNLDGKGGYTLGFITFHQQHQLYIYVGGKGEYNEENKEQEGGFNGGGKGGKSINYPNYYSAGRGGGASDIRVNN